MTAPMSPRVLPKQRDPRPQLALSVAGFAFLLVAVGVCVFLGGAWIASRIWPLEAKP